MNHIKTINELFGINNAIRLFRNEDEIEAREIQILLSTKKYSDLKYNEKKVKEEFIKSYTFSIESHRSFIDHEMIRVEFSNWMHPIYTPGMTDFNVYYNDVKLNCSSKIAQDIYRLAKKLSPQK